MTKTFNELSLDTDIEEMSEEEAKETLADFMDAHTANQKAYDARISEIHETEQEYSEKLEQYEDMVAEFTERRAEKAAEYVKMPAELLADRFSYEELDQIIEEGEDADFSEEDETDEEEEDDDRLTTFADRPEKGKKESKNKTTAEFRERAQSALANKGFPTGN